MATKPDAAAAAVEKTMLALLAKLEPPLVERDALKITGDMRRARQAAARIRELLAQLKSTDQVAALGGALAISYESGYVEASTTGVSPVGGKGVSQALDRNEMLALGRVAADPLAAVLADAKSPIPFVAPKMIPEKQARLAEIVMQAKAKGLTWSQTAKLVQEEMPETGRPVQNQLIRGAAVQLEGGYVIGVEKYAMMLARTTSVWASNKGTVDWCDDNGVETVKVNVAAGATDFCLELEGCVFALTQKAADTFQVPLLEDAPNGGPPFHPNCRHSVSPFAVTKARAGKLPTADESVLTGKGKGAATEAQQGFRGLLNADPVPYAQQIAETAARQGFGSQTQKMDSGWYRAFVGKEIPGLPPGRHEVFGKRALSEDAHLMKRVQEGLVTSRREYRQIVADTLRAGAAAGSGDVLQRKGDIYYHDSKTGWVASVDAETGQVNNAFKLDKSWSDYAEEKGLQ
jgi:hypothetical protein